MFTPARDRNAPFDVDDVAGLVGRLGAHAPVPIERGVVVVVSRRRRAADAEHVAARAAHDEVNRASSSRGGPGVRAVVAARGAISALAVHAAGGHAVRGVFGHLVGPAVRLEGLGLARGRLGHVAMAIGTCARYDWGESSECSFGEVAARREREARANRSHRIRDYVECVSARGIAILFASRAQLFGIYDSSRRESKQLHGSCE